jgi:hypothetical protein
MHQALRSTGPGGGDRIVGVSIDGEEPFCSHVGVQGGHAQVRRS